MLTIACAIVFFTAIVFLVFKIKEIQNYFQKKNIPCVEPIFLLGSVPSSESYTSVYESLSPHKIGGFYETIQPVFMVRDPEYVQQVLINNYSNFYDRGFQVDEKLNPLDGNVFFLNGSKWRFLRTKMSPIFTSRKIQSLYNEMMKCTDHFIDHLNNLEGHGKEINLKMLLLRFTINVVASTAFGMEMEGFEDTKSERMFEIGKEIFVPGTKISLFLVLRFMNPKILSTLKIKTVPQEIDKYFVGIVTNAIAHRQRMGQSRNDVIQSLMQLREKGSASLKDDAKDDDTTEITMEMTDELLAAQAFIFFIAGSETTTNTLYSLLYLFSIHHEIQETARQEVNSTIQAHGSLNFDALKDMNYLDMCVKETLRLFPPAPIHLRMCTKDFTFSDGTTVKKGDRVIIPAFNIQRDPNNFEDPFKFKPERFLEPPRPGTYLPLGDGPKICIGKLFAETEIKMAASRLLQKFKFQPASHSQTDLSKIKFESNDFFLSPTGGFWVRMEKI